MWGGQGWLYYGFAEFNGYNLVPVQFFNQYNLFPDSHVTFVSRLVLELRALGLFDQRKVTRRTWEQKLYFNWERFRLYETASKWFGLPKLSFVVKCSLFLHLIVISSLLLLTVLSFQEYLHLNAMPSDHYCWHSPSDQEFCTFYLSANLSCCLIVFCFR